MDSVSKAIVLGQPVRALEPNALTLRAREDYCDAAFELRGSE
jgi:hypothetical protein